ncbi:MAG: hypothetical protein V1740_06080 [Candidatus Woesearchaeota archaeon]
MEFQPESGQESEQVSQLEAQLDTQLNLQSEQNPEPQSYCRRAWKSGKKWLRRTALAIAIPIAAYAVSIPAVYAANKALPYHQKTAVFTSGNDPFWPEPIAIGAVDFFMYTPVTLRQIRDRNKVDWFSNYKKDDILDVIADPDYQNIVFIGNGQSDRFYASDRVVTAEDIYRIGISKKSGMLVQHTCGDTKYSPTLRDVLLEDSGNSFFYDHRINEIKNFVIAWFRVISKG